jgi:branched-subunit amino acid transport protein
MTISKIFTDARRQEASHELSLLARGVAGVLAYSGYTENHFCIILQGIAAWIILQAAALVAFPKGGAQ